ncbi:DDE-type integrase/transposase/recombinase [Marivivens aquimaris]|uniref:DDE-type integrase/transposase/recombinase n=1 Tax=Marivivens aquimaris TaxID=2774876 RepID=UPI00389928D8
MLKAANEFQHRTTAINQLWQTDFTYINLMGWGWFYLSTDLGEYSRYIVSWKLCTTMRAEGVTNTLDLALQASGCDQVLMFTSHVCSATTDPVMSRAIWQNGCKTKA